MVERGEADLSAALLIINEERAGAVNFSLPISLEPYTLMFQRPQEESRALLFIYPFQPLVCTDSMILLQILSFLYSLCIHLTGHKFMVLALSIIAFQRKIYEVRSLKHHKFCLDVYFFRSCSSFLMVTHVYAKHTPNMI